MKSVMRYNQRRSAWAGHLLGLLPLLILFVLLIVFDGNIAHAQDLKNPSSYGSFTLFICGVLSFLKTIARPLGVIFIVIAGIQFVTARGNEQKITEAKGAILWASIGLFVLFLGPSLISIAADIMGPDVILGNNACL